MISYRVGSLHTLTQSELKALLILVPMSSTRGIWIEACMDQFGWSREAAERFTLAVQEKARALVI